MRPVAELDIVLFLLEATRKFKYGQNVPTNKTGLSLQQNPGRVPPSLRLWPEPRKSLLVADDTPLDSGLRRNDASQHFGRFLYKVEQRA